MIPMFLTVHRGSREVGGTCVELRSGKSHIVLDVGMPLVKSDGSEFDMREYDGLSGQELHDKSVLPQVRGLYEWEEPESPRLSWRLHSLRGWSHEYTKEISTGAEGTGGAHGLRPRTGVRVAVGGDALHLGKVRHDGRDAAHLGETGRT